MADGQKRKHPFAMLLVQLPGHVGSIVWRHATEDLGDLFVGPILQELALMVVVELLEHVGLELDVVLADSLDDLLALPPRGSLHQIGDLGRMQLCELGMGYTQSHGRHMSDERLDARPVQEVAGGDAVSERLGQQSPESSAWTGVDAD